MHGFSSLFGLLIFSYLLLNCDTQEDRTETPEEMTTLVVIRKANHSVVFATLLLLGILLPAAVVTLGLQLITFKARLYAITNFPVESAITKTEYYLTSNADKLLQQIGEDELESILTPALADLTQEQQIAVLVTVLDKARKLKVEAEVQLVSIHNFLNDEHANSDEDKMKTRSPLTVPAITKSQTNKSSKKSECLKVDLREEVKYTPSPTFSKKKKAKSKGEPLSETSRKKPRQK